MGDYGFGVLVKNGSGNKSTFPVRIPPHLQPQHSHHPSNPPSPPSFVNNTCSTNGGSAWLFPAVTPHTNMQDEILESEKSKALDLQDMQEKSQVQAQPQALSPGQQEAGGGLGELEGALPDDGSLEKGTLESSAGKEKLRMESPVLSGFDYQDTLGMGTSCAQSTSSSSSLTSFNNWSPAVPSTQSPVVGEDVGGFFGPAGSNANGPHLLFHNFSHHAGPGFGAGGSFSPQIGPVSQHHPPTPHPQHYHPQGQGVPQQHRRSPASPHQPQPSFPPHPHRTGPFTQLPHLAPTQNKPPSPWGSYQSPSTPTSTSWSPGGYGGWGGTQGIRDYRRGVGGGMSGLNSISPLKKSFPNNQVDRAVMRTRSFDGFSMQSLENSLIDIMRAEQDSLKRSYGRRRHSSLFPMEDERSFGDDESGDQGLAGLGPGHCFASLNGERVERYSRKVFVGGLPPDIDEEITASFRRFGHLFVDWPHKAESKSYFPPKYAFLLFQDESSVQALIDACIQEDGKLYLCVSSPTIKDKPVEVKPYVLDDQLCDECQGTRCGGKFAPFFCANVTCLQYYCEYCWAAIHSRAGREFHKPLVKEGGDRPRHISFRWN
uniref:Cytoplasmic polyadenylation element-binding protein 4-like n=1 Tax=Pundamilia nyererei TaxID=303518 RepID=A0A3B4EQG2_9CICH